MVYERPHARVGDVRVVLRRRPSSDRANGRDVAAVGVCPFVAAHHVGQVPRDTADGVQAFRLNALQVARQRPCSSLQLAEDHQHVHDCLVKLVEADVLGPAGVNAGEGRLDAREQLNEHIGEVLAHGRDIRKILALFAGPQSGDLEGHAEDGEGATANERLQHRNDARFVVGQPLDERDHISNCGDELLGLVQPLPLLPLQAKHSLH